MASMPPAVDVEVGSPVTSDDEQQEIGNVHQEDMGNPLRDVQNIDELLYDNDADSATIGEILVRMYDWMSKHKSTDSSGTYHMAMHVLLLFVYYLFVLINVGIS